MKPRLGAGVLLGVAAAHTVPALWLGAQDGDYSLLWAALPFVVLTLLCAVAVRFRWEVTALLLAAVAFALAVLAVPVYLLGLLHVAQALVALGVTVAQVPGSEEPAS